MKKVFLLVFFISSPVFAVDVTITIDNTVATRVLNDFCAHFNYQDTLQDPVNRNGTIPNPQTKLQFFQQYLGDYLKGIAISEEAKNAAEATRTSILNNSSQLLITVH